LEKVVLYLASRLCFVVAISLLVCAGAWIVVSGDAAPTPGALVIEEPELDIGELPPGAHIIIYRVRNTTQRPQRIVGLAEG
jgi:hypothetical protein